MNSKVIKSLLLAAILSSGVCIAGCETSHSESDKPGMFGGHTHEESTTTKNPVTGDMSTSHVEKKTAE